MIAFLIILYTVISVMWVQWVFAGDPFHPITVDVAQQHQASPASEGDALTFYVLAIFPGVGQYFLLVSTLLMFVRKVSRK